MPKFELAVIWTSAAQSSAVTNFIRSLDQHFPSEKLDRMAVVSKPGSVALNLDVDFGFYQRAALNAAQADAGRCGGTFIELLRINDADRDRFREQYLKAESGVSKCESYAQAAKIVVTAMQALGSGQPAPAAEASAAKRAPATASQAAPQRPSASPNPASPPQAAPAPTPTPAPRPAQQRVAPRFDVHLKVDFETEAQFVTEYASNISKGGMFVRTKERPAPNTFIALKIRLPNGRELATQARVVHSFDHPEHGGVGVAFEKSDPKFTEDLEQYLMSLSAEPKK